MTPAAGAPPLDGRSGRKTCTTPVSCLAAIACVAVLAAGPASSAEPRASRPRAIAEAQPARPPLRCAGDGPARAPEASSAAPSPLAGPEVATGFASKDVVHAPTVMAVTANPIASRAACEVLARGGAAIDAAIVAQMVLNLVEPQSSGIGGGAFLLYYDAKRRVVESYDGRETAPSAATENDLRWVDADVDRTSPRPNARASGRSIGTPGVLRMLELVHRAHGRQPWASLFDPAIALAAGGFRVSPRMHASVAAFATGLARDADAAAYFLGPDGRAKPVGTVLTNPALAATFATIARGGADAFYGGDLAQAIVDRIADTRDGTTAGRTTLDDLAAYRAKRRDPVCTPYRTYVVCGMGPPSSGGLAVAATLGIVGHFDLGAKPPRAVDRDGGRPDAAAVHLIAEAERLAYADRDRYVADTDFVPLPGGSPARLVDPGYLGARAATIDASRSMGRATAGDFGTAPQGVDPTPEQGTSHLVIGDRDGNVVTMTTSIESGFGSYHFVRGFLLNNQLTDFAANPADSRGAPIANRMGPRKRPRSTMAPTLVFERAPDGGIGAFVLATGSAGGSVIVQYVVKTLVGVLDWKLDAQQAVSSIDFGAANTPTTLVGGEHPDVDASDGGAHDPLVIGLRARGHTVSVAPQSSGLTLLRRVMRDGRPAWEGGADPRREGIAVGDSPRR